MTTTEMQQQGTAQCARITVRTPDGDTMCHDVTPADNLIVGSSANCRIRLECIDVAAMHCLIRLEDGRLSVQDWYTTAGTFLNGEKLQTQTGFAPADEIRIGDYRLTAQFIDSAEVVTNAGAQVAVDSTDDAGQTGAESRLDALLAAPALRLSDDGRPESSSVGETSESDAAQDLPRDDADLQREILRLRARVEDLEKEAAELREQTWELESATVDGVDAFDAEMVDLLRSEVEQLQIEVSQRDARIAELTESASNRDASHESAADSSELATLVSRLEQLLEELQKSDERVATLEDLLHCADEATSAEQEERRQLGAWVREIEDRIGEREGEFRAENVSLQKRIGDLTAERERFDEKFRDVGHAGSAQQSQLIDELRDEITQLSDKLRSSEEERQTLCDKIDGVEFQDSENSMKKQVEELMRHERLELAQEHAQISRDRAELARMQSDAKKPTDRTGGGRGVDEAACRVQAFREHLKDLHKEENEAKGKGPKSLSARLAGLWKRLDGR